MEPLTPSLPVEQPTLQVELPEWRKPVLTHIRHYR